MAAKIKKWLHTCVQRVGVSQTLVERTDLESEFCFCQPKWRNVFSLHSHNNLQPSLYLYMFIMLIVEWFDLPTDLPTHRPTNGVTVPLMEKYDSWLKFHENL